MHNEPEFEELPFSLGLLSPITAPEFPKEITENKDYATVENKLQLSFQQPNSPSKKTNHGIIIPLER